MCLRVCALHMCPCALPASQTKDFYTVQRTTEEYTYEGATLSPILADPFRRMVEDTMEVQGHPLNDDDGQTKQRVQILAQKMMQVSRNLLDIEPDICIHPLIYMLVRRLWHVLILTLTEFVQCC